MLKKMMRQLLLTITWHILSHKYITEHVKLTMKLSTMLNAIFANNFTPFSVKTHETRIY